MRCMLMFPSDVVSHNAGVYQLLCVRALIYFSVQPLPLHRVEANPHTVLVAHELLS